MTKTEWKEIKTINWFTYYYLNNTTKQVYFKKWNEKDWFYECIIDFDDIENENYLYLMKNSFTRIDKEI